MFIFTYTAAVMTVFFVATAALLFLKGRKDSLTYTFIFCLLASAVWIGSNAAADVSYTVPALILTSGIALIGGTFLVTFFLVFVDIFVDQKMPERLRLLLYLIPSIVSTAFAFSTYSIQGTFFPAGQPAQIILGSIYYLSILFLFSGLTYGIMRLISVYKRDSGKRRLQALYIIIGFSALFFGQAFFSIILPLTGELRFYNLAPQFSLIFAIASGYAIFKHNLLDIKIIIQRGLIYVILLVGIVSLYIMILNSLGVLLEQMTRVTLILSAGLTTVIGIFTVPYIDNYLRLKTDRFFFKGTYDFAETSHVLSEILNRNISRQKIVDRLTSKLLETLKSSYVTITDKRNQSFDSRSHEDVSLIIPITLKENLMGDLILGEKLSGDVYTDTDKQLLSTLSNQIATAFERAKLHEEVEEYSKSLEKKVVERTTELHEAHEQQRQMISNISHSIQTPLTVLKAELDLIRPKLPNDKNLETLETTLTELSNFIYDFLRLAELESQSEIAEIENVHLSELLETIVEYIAVVADDKNIKLSHAISPDIYVQGSTKKLKEICLSILSNAMKYMPEDGERSISIELQHENNDTLIQFKDTGTGIEKEHVSKIFNRFYRAPRTKHIQGSGLGLAITKQLVEQHGGTILVESEYGNGTTFTIQLPKARS